MGNKKYNYWINDEIFTEIEVVLNPNVFEENKNYQNMKDKEYQNLAESYAKFILNIDPEFDLNKLSKETFTKFSHLKYSISKNGLARINSDETFLASYYIDYLEYNSKDLEDVDIMELEGYLYFSLDNKVDARRILISTLSKKEGKRVADIKLFEGNGDGRAANEFLYWAKRWDILENQFYE